MIRNKASKFINDSSVLPRYLHGADLPSAVEKSRGKSESSHKTAKEKFKFPPIGGWKGGHPDANSIKMSETYGAFGGNGTISKTECYKKGKVLRS